MARPRKAKIENSLLKALRHIVAAQKANGSPEQTHCRLFNHWAVATNSVLSAAHPIVEDIQACPHTYSLIDALEQSGETVSLTLLDSTRLAVRSGDFQAVIPCLEGSGLPAIYPDAAQAICDERLKSAMQVVGTLAAEGAQKLVNASVQLRNGVCVASDGNVILEAFHGISMPPLMLAPKTLVTALGKWNKTLTSFGVSSDFHSITFWFDDGSWLKSQCYDPASELPDLYKFLNVESVQPFRVPKGLFAVAKRLQPFSEDGKIYFTEDGARVTAPTQLTNAADSIKGVPVGLSVSIKSLLMIEAHCKYIAFNAMPNITLFFNDNVRGAIVTG